MLKYLAIIILFLGSVQANSQSCDLDFEDFEVNGTTPPAGWQRIGAYLTSVGSPFSGTYNAGFNTEDDILIVEPIDCPKQICFYWRASGNTSSYDIDIDWSDDNESTWNTVHTIRVQDSSTITTYRQTCLDLPLNSFSPSTNIKIRFHQVNRITGSWYLDDVCMSSGGVTKLTFTETPSGCNIFNTDFTTTVCATDDCGNIDTAYTSNVTIDKNSGSGTLSGTTTLPATNGCAIFTDLRFNAAGNYILQASDGVLINDTSSIIDVKSNCPTVDTLTVVTYNLLNFPIGRNDCGGGNIQPANRVDTLKKIMKYMQPDILMVCELQNSAGADLILNSALNVDGETKYAKANFVLNSSSGATGLYNMFYYNSEKVTFYSQDVILTDLRDINEYVIYGKDPNLGSNKDTTFIDFYEAHLKAGSGASDKIRRSNEATSIRNYIDSKSAGRNNIIGGDFNFYTNTETAYQTLCYSGTYPFNDPISREGSWNNNFSFADVHSQSTRSSNQIECGATGGTDDRFDFLLVSDNVLSGVDRVNYVANSYSSLGNNGSTYNGNINDASNTSSVPSSILNALFYMSDHLPVVMKVALEYPSTSLGINDDDEKNRIDQEIISFDIFPNPAKDHVNIGFDINNKEHLRLEISNILGQELSNFEIDSEKGTIMLDISDLDKGMYFVSLMNDFRVLITKKLIIK